MEVWKVYYKDKFQDLWYLKVLSQVVDLEFQSGTNSILGGTQPLYVLDGIPVDPLTDAQGMDGSGESQSSLSFINPNDIDKIEVLKDVAATAIYGARGANGVI